MSYVRYINDMVCAVCKQIKVLHYSEISYEARIRSTDMGTIRYGYVDTRNF